MYTRSYYFVYGENWIATFNSATDFQINPENEMNFRFAVYGVYNAQSDRELLCASMSLVRIFLRE